MTSPRTFIQSRREMEKVLSEERVGYLGLSVQGLPYVVPLTYAYIDGTILFHCAMKGKKLDAIRENPRVCFTLSRHFGEMVPHPQGAVCHVNSDSVICYGVARVIDDVKERRKVLDVFNQCLQPNAKEITIEDVSNWGRVRGFG